MGVLSTPIRMVDRAKWIGKETWWSIRDTTYPIESGTAKCDFHLRSRYEFLSFEHGLNGERDVLDAFIESVQPGDTVWDIGGHVGVYACLAGTQTTDVVVFEPHPENAKRIAENAELNDVSLDVHESALVDEETTLEFTTDSTQAGRGGTLADTPGQMKLNVEGVTGEDLIATGRVTAPDVMKIDIEGAELLALHGFGEYLTECRELFIEVHPEKLGTYGHSEAELHELLEDDFSIEEIDSRESEYHLHCRNYSAL